MARFSNTSSIFNKYHYKFLLPGILLGILGAGNILVGLKKEGEYQQVLASLARDTVSMPEDSAPPLSRIHSLEESSNRLYERRTKALTRIDFYQLVVFGGKMFLIISAVFLGLTASIIFYSRKESQKVKAH